MTLNPGFKVTVIGHSKVINTKLCLYQSHIITDNSYEN